MEDLRFWKLGKNDVARSGEIQRELERICNPRTKPLGLEVSFSSPVLDFESDNAVYYVVGESLGDLLGYAECYVSEAKRNIGDASWILNNAEREDLKDFDGKLVDKRNIKNYEGYSKYMGKGSVLSIALIDIFIHRRKIGSKLIDFIKRDNPEIIDAKANGYEPSQFFEANGFVDTGIDSSAGRQILMVWNNPLYVEPKI